MRVAVLGAGLQGACAAMALAARGVRVDLFDRYSRPLTQASSQNEGKIHLGYVYAHDRSGRSARLMVIGAMSFAPLLRGWLGAAFDAVPVSSPFVYLVHAQSMLTIAAVRDHIEACRAHAAEVWQRDGGDYFGRDCRAPVHELSARQRAASFDGRTVQAAFQTPEVAIDPEHLAATVRTRLPAIPEIALRLRTTVLSIAADDRAASVRYDADGTPGQEHYDHVVNTLWDDRLAVDATAGIRPRRPAWMWRFKRLLRTGVSASPVDLPSVTVVLGPFGDVVNFGNGSVVLSWYPAGCVLRSHAIRPPPPDALTADEADRLRRDTLAGLGGILPSLTRLVQADQCELKGGMIFAWGGTDIVDPHSGLHERFEIGVTSLGRLHTVDTGKLTMAPYFGEQVAVRLLGRA